MSEHNQQHSTWLAVCATGFSVYELWLHYFSLGGNLTTFEVDAYLHDAYRLPETERNMVTIALNELLDELPHGPKAKYRGAFESN